MSSPPAVPAFTVARLVSAFLDWTGRHRSPATARFYAARLKLFLAKFSKREAASLTSLEFDAYLEEAGRRPAAGGEPGKPYSDSTRHHNAVALTTLQSFALREYLLEKPWFRHLEKPPMGRRQRIPATAEIAKLLSAAPADFRLIYTALSQSGARPGELCRAQIADVDWSKGTITLLEHKTARKTGKPRVIPLGKNLAATLRQAIGERTAGPIFLSASGHAWCTGSLSSLHRRLRDKAGLPRDLVLYLARHRFGTEALRAGVPLKDVADLMGHASVTTTEIYLHRDVAELAHNQDKIPELGMPAPSSGDADPPTVRPALPQSGS